MLSLHLSLLRHVGSQQNFSPTSDLRNDSFSGKRLSSFLVKSAHADPLPLTSLIAVDEMDTALNDALLLMNMTQTDIKGQGWNLVHGTDMFSLYKRRDKRNGGPSTYLMLGKFNDVSARTFLHAQISQAERKIWDTTMRAMKPLTKATLELSKENSEDILYFKTGWPWPLKDRDYVLARRCKIYDEKKAIVFVSKSTEVSMIFKYDRHRLIITDVKAMNLPKEKNVIRVDSYWCHSTIVSRSKDLPTQTILSISTNDDADKEKYNHGFLLSGGGKGIFGLKVPSAVSDRLGAAAKKFHDAEKKIQSSFPRFPVYNPWDHLHQRHKQRDPSHAASALDLPGLQFCTIFCDDSKVSLS